MTLMVPPLESVAPPVSFDASVIIPANNEAEYIGACLAALLSQDQSAGRLQIIVSANACTDRTESIVETFVPAAVMRGWALCCQSDKSPGKAPALNRADALAQSDLRIYLDADIVCEPSMVGALRSALSGPEPAYAAGRIVLAPSRNWITRAYGNFWSRLPFVADGGTGAGLFAVNAAGRRRWHLFPPIISDDTFVRLSFSPDERHEVQATYTWPMVDGLSNLVRVRRRQDAGVGEVYRLYPQLRMNEGKRPVRWMDLLRMGLGDPLGFVVYVGVSIVVRAQPASGRWSRGR